MKAAPVRHRITWNARPIAQTLQISFHSPICGVFVHFLRSLRCSVIAVADCVLLKYRAPLLLSQME